VETIEIILVELSPILIVLAAAATWGLLKNRLKNSQKEFSKEVLEKVVETSLFYAEKRAIEMRQSDNPQNEEEERKQKIQIATQRVKEILQESGILDFAEEEIERIVSNAMEKPKEEDQN